MLWRDIFQLFSVSSMAVIVGPSKSSKSALGVTVPNNMLHLWYTKVQIGGDDYIGLLNNSITGSVIQIAPTAARLRESIRTKAYRVVAMISCPTVKRCMEEI